MTGASDTLVQNPAYRDNAFLFYIITNRTMNFSKLKEIYQVVIRTAYLAVRFFTTKRVLNQASALTYSTLLAIVPILAVVFAIARGFGYNKYIEVWFRDSFSSQPQVAETMIGFVNSYLVHTKSIR